MVRVGVAQRCVNKHTLFGQVGPGCLPMVQKRHSGVVADMLQWFHRQVDIPCLRGVAIAADRLTSVVGFTPTMRTR